jgi:hypothetical protein
MRFISKIHQARQTAFPLRFNSSAGVPCLKAQPVPE